VEREVDGTATRRLGEREKEEIERRGEGENEN